MVYSRFLVARQDGHTINTTVNFNHRRNVRTRNLVGSVEIGYRLPALVRWLSAAGLTGLLALLGWELPLTRPSAVQAGQ